MYTGLHVIKNGLIFGYDTNYGVADNGLSTRFYKGRPTTNISANHHASGHNSGNYGNVVTVVDAPEKGDRWKKVTISNRGSNFRIVQWQYTSHTSDVVYSHSAEFDWGNMRGKGYSMPFDGSGGGTRNYYRNKNYSSNGGTSIDVNLKDGHFASNIVKSGTHVHAWFIYHSTTGVSGLNDYFYYRDYQVEVSTTTSPYTSSSRSNTNSLLDLTKTVNIDVSNVSFDSTGQPDFDGTDDRIVSSTGVNLSSYTSLTYEGVVKAVGLASHDRWFSGTNSGDTGFHNPDLAIGTNGQLGYIFSGSGIGSWNMPSGLTIDTTKFNHLVYTFTNTGVVKIYVNGTQEYTATHSNATFPSNSKFMTGMRFDNNGEGVDGSIPIAKVYSRALSADEVKTNFLAYSRRFNI